MALISHIRLATNQSWLVVLDGKGRGLWSSRKMLVRQVGLSEARRIVPDGVFAFWEDALACWFRHREDYPVIGVGGSVYRPDDYLKLDPAFAEEVRAIRARVRMAAGQYLLQVKAGEDQAEAVALRREEGQEQTVGKVHILFKGDSLEQTAWLACIEGLLLFPSATRVHIIADLPALQASWEGKRQHQDGHTRRYLGILRAIAHQQGLELCFSGTAPATPDSIELFLRHLPEGLRAGALEVLRNERKPPQIKFWPIKAVTSTAKKHPELYQAALQRVRAMTKQAFAARKRELLLKAMSGKPPTPEQIKVLKEMGLTPPADRAEASRMIEEFSQHKHESQ